VPLTYIRHWRAFSAVEHFGEERDVHFLFASAVEPSGPVGQVARAPTTGDLHQARWDRVALLKRDAVPPYFAVSAESEIKTHFTIGEFIGSREAIVADNP